MTEPTLHHARQTSSSGCNWHAMYALFGDDGLLDYAPFASLSYWAAVLAHHGVLILTHYEGVIEQRPAPLHWWAAFRQVLYPGHAPLALTVLTGRILHMIAVQYPKDPDQVVLVSDSLRNSVKRFTLEEFHEHPVYGQALAVYSFLPADPASHDRHDVRERGVQTLDAYLAGGSL